MPDQLPIGEFEELILLAVAAESTEAYGLSVRDLIHRETGRMVTLATVHSALYRLERKGFLRSRLGGATSERGGRSKRYFEVTASGHQILDAKENARQRLRRLVPQYK